METDNKDVRGLKRGVIGIILFAVGLWATILGIRDANLVRITFGLPLIVAGVSILFSRTDREAGKHARGVLLGYGLLRKDESRVRAERDRDN